MLRPSRMLPLLATLSVVPSARAATPVVVTTLSSAAVATEPGVAEAIATPSGITTQVKVAVTTVPAPAVTTVPTPAPAPRLAPPAPPTAEELYAQELRTQIHDDRGRGRGLLASGLAVVGTAYLFTSLAGALAIDRARDITDDPTTPENEGHQSARRRSFGRALLVPGIGPALAIARGETAVRSWAAGVAGISQALGVGLAAVGVHRLLRARRLERLSLSAAGSSRQAHVSVQVRF